MPAAFEALPGLIPHRPCAVQRQGGGKGFDQAGPLPPASMAEKGRCDVGAGIRHASSQRRHLPRTRIQHRPASFVAAGRHFRSFLFSRQAQRQIPAVHYKRLGFHPRSLSGPFVPGRRRFRRLASIRPPWAPVYHSPGERGINGAKKKDFSHAKKLSEKPSRRNRIKKEQPPCSGRPFPVTRTKRATKGMRSDRTAGMLSHGC